MEARSSRESMERRETDPWVDDWMSLILGGMRLTLGRMRLTLGWMIL